VSALFFQWGSSRTGTANPFQRETLQPSRQLASPTPDGFDVHARNLEQQPIAAVAGLHGFQGHEPAAVVFVQSAQKQIQTPMELFVWALGRL
jgi:hypothetical protein